MSGGLIASASNSSLQKQSCGGAKRRSRGGLPTHRCAEGLQVVAATAEAQALAAALLRAAVMPRKAALDAAHVAIATVHGLDFLVTWNCTHIANAAMRPQIEAVCRHAGFQPSIICTPEELAFEEAT